MYNFNEKSNKNIFNLVKYSSKNVIKNNFVILKALIFLIICSNQRLTFSYKIDNNNNNSKLEKYHFYNQKTSSFNNRLNYVVENEREKYDHNDDDDDDHVNYINRNHKNYNNWIKLKRRRYLRDIQLDSTATESSTIVEWSRDKAIEELNYKQESCSPSYFTCGDGKCIPLRWKCDSKPDCSDGSDESAECARESKCNEGQFQCKFSRKCIPDEWVCDGDNDCGKIYDLSDEHNCSNTNKCLAYETTCDNGYCLDISKFCDGKWDCDSDEKYCENKTTICSNLTCSHACTSTPNGPKCYCPPGLVSNGTECQDFDECTIPGICDQICKNIPKSYECSCVSGYIKNKNRCYAINVPKNENASLVFLTQGDIRVTTLDGRQLSLYKNQDTSAIEIWHRNRTVCAMYSSSSSPILRCHKIEDLNINWEIQIPEMLIGLNSIDQIRIDWISSNWYFLNNELSLIFMCTSNMQYCSIILENILNKPSSMALDPTKGYLFITEWSPSLTRCNLDGTKHQVIATNKIFYPSEITLDLANEHVYWIDTFTDFIERVNYDGNNRWSMKRNSESYLFIKSLHSLDIFENTIYISSWSNKSISAMDRFTLKAERIISKVVRAFDLRVFHKQKQPEVPHPCRHNNGGCQQICVPIWKNQIAIAQCVCSPGYRLKTKTECVLVKHESFLLYAKQKFTRIKGISMSIDSQNGANSNQEAIVPIFNVKWPIIFDINVKDQLIYFMQFEMKGFSISSQKLDGTNRQLLLNGTDCVTGIAYDWISNHIYWGGLETIYVVSLNNTNIRRSFTIQRDPVSIAVDPKHGIIYWTHWYSSHSQGMIKSAWLDGTHEKIITSDTSMYSTKWPVSLTIDYQEKKIYWCDIKENTIERISFDMTFREIIFKDNQYSPISIAYHNQYIFWSDNKNGSIMRFHVNDRNISDSQKFIPKNLILVTEKERVSNLKIFDNFTQTEINDCVNTKCHGICLQTPNGAVCKCADGYTLNAETNRCIKIINFDIATNCTKGFSCSKTNKCIDIKDVCDGIDDCDDGSDEDYSENGPCNINNCNKSISYVCDKVRCLQNTSRCGVMSLCTDGTDQKNCTTLICNPNEFKCKKSGLCIPMTWVNDGSKDCGPDDVSDEVGILFAKCPEFECKNKLCASFVDICDGLNQCGDNSDEVDCETHCGTDEKYCQPIGCYNKTHHCDGIIDCLDVSDELNCTITSPSDNGHEKITPVCGFNEFACKESFECVSIYVVCDGTTDCFDKSDELNCNTTTTKMKQPSIKNNQTIICDHPARLCKISNKCITVDKLCDGTIDCEDGSDEGFRCFEKMCDRNTDCSHYCYNAPEGFVCACPAHMFLEPNGYRCNMEHSCEHWDTCSQICEKDGKSYKCKCYDGYTLQFDKFTCKSNNPDSPYVIFSNRQEIRGVDLKTSAVKNFYASLRNTIALDFLYLNNSVQIFWTDVIDDKIYRGTLIGESIGNVEAVVQSGLSTAEGLAVDWIGMNLYWIDSNLDQIEVALTNGSFRRTLVAGEMESPRAIALDPRDGLLFWTDWDEDFPRIERCSMAGEPRKIIIQVNQVSGAWPNGLTLDYSQRRVYWVDARSDSIHTTNYDGDDHHLVIRDQETLSHPFSISLFENYVYWTDWRTNSVIRANKWNGSDIQVIHRTQTQPFGIQVLHSSRQPKGVNPCGTNNGGCSHLCLIHVNKTYKCECPHVMRLDLKDQKTCVPNEQILLFIMGSEIRGIDLMQPNHHTIPTISHSPQVLGPQRIDYTVDDNRLYWSDTQLNEIKTAGLSNGLIETILNTDIQKPFGFAVDWISKYIYVSSGKTKCHILVCNVKGEYVTEIHKDLDIVESIALDPANGRMYWSHSNKDAEIYLIESSALDGSLRRMLYNSSKPVQSLTIDFDSNRLYFVYYNSGIISYYDIILEKVIEVLSSSGAMQISGVTVYNNSLYFPENMQSVIMSCDKDNCHQTMNILRKNTNSVQALKMYYLEAQKDTNACVKDNNNCQHLCLATSKTSYTCKCAIGFDPDPREPSHCIGKPEILLYSIGHEIKGIKLYRRNEIISNKNLEDEEKEKALGPISLISLATNIDYYAKEDYLFWADSEKGTITHIKRDGTHREVILKQLDQLDPNNSDWLGGIAVDWVAKNIYWSDQKRNIIEVARLNGSYRYILLSNVEKPTALSVDPIAGYLFYVGDGFIGRSGLDGSQVFILVNQTKSASNIVLDIENQMVYWCETQTDTIMRVDYDGNRKTVMLNHSLENPTALALIDNLLYWVDNSHHKGMIQVASVHNLSDYRTILKSEGNSIRDLKIFSKQIQEGMNNVCATNNGGCKELCLFNGTDPICTCSHGRLAADGKSCEDHDIFLIYSTGSSIESIHMTNHMNLNSPIERIQNFTFMRNIIGLSFDYEKRRIFYSDIHMSTINMVYFNATNHTTIVNNQVTVEGLTFDPLNNQLYWTSNNDASIRSLDLNLIGNHVDNNTALVKHILKLSSHDKPRGIQIEPCLAMVYWTNWNSQAASIQRAYVSGYGLQSIIKTDIRMPNALALDYEEKKLYWADARLDKVERTDYDGTHRVVLAHSTPKHPFAMAIYGDLLFWTDWVLHAVVRANKYSGSDVIFLRKDIGRPFGIAAVQNLMHNCNSNKCSIVNGGCEDVCLLNKNGNVQCQCTRGILARDGHSCIQHTNGKCGLGEFLCGSGECIPYALTCDEVPHCLDQSDEKINFCFARECPEDFFMCSNRRCIPLNQTCDGVENCGDRSDEAFCPCQQGKFKCGSGECLDASLRCDNMADCHDASDEMHCPPRECTSGDALFFHCESTTACYMQSWRCDGENDCWDGSDEVNCDNITRPACGPGQFRCDNGHCINERWRCDGEDDCIDGKQPSSDEANCEVQCKQNEFKCDNTCIPSTWQCDETADCIDGTDEGSQCPMHHCDESMFLCNSTGRCIPPKWVCDGDADCAGKEDESEHCAIVSVTRIASCLPPYFLCTSGECLEPQHVCDGDLDCEHGDDEYTGCIPSQWAHPQCNENEFRCDNGECIPQNATCNLKNDCVDNSDENPKICKNSTKICAEPKFFRCANGACVHSNRLCDGRNDCGDFSDEQTCQVNECLTEGLCSQNCTDLKVGYECTCFKGYKVNPLNRNLCEDVDECVEDRPCSQKCYNTVGSYHCGCIEGFKLRDKTVCKAISEEHTELIFSNRYYIRKVGIRGNMSILVHQLSNAVALDFEWKSNCLFWSDVTSTVSTIKKHCLNENKTTTLHHTMLKNPDGLAVDWIAHNLYWCDKGLDTIEVSNLDGKYRKVLINKNLSEPRGIVLDPFRKYIYWSDWGETPYIAKAGMDGTKQKIIIQDNLGWPNALTISFETDELFWGDAREDFIAVSDLDGKNQRVLLSRSQNSALKLHHIFAIAVWEDKIFWSDWETKSIEYCHKYSGQNCSTLVTTIHRPMDLRIFHPYRQLQNGTNPCENANCSTLCLLSPDPPYYKCMCPNNYILQNDTKSCKANCTAAHFECVNTYKCIPFYWKCDNQDDCGDGSDEPKTCPQFYCEPGQYQCENTKCISPSAICDGVNNCGDNSDEINCDTFSCFDNYFKCGRSANQSAFCIENNKKCNGIKDCPNGEDEIDCKQNVCRKNQFQCQNGLCIPLVWVCDGDNDCRDETNSDETNCSERSCSSKEFLCKSGRCIPKSWICDMENDCGDLEDELQNCHSSEHHTCEPTYFKCNNTKCIPGRWRCDYDNDCGDNSDELNCELRNCSESEFRCGTGKCLKFDHRCDGEIDCEDATDEMNCNITCKPNEWKCSTSNTCINIQYKCDGDDDCPDGSDEVNCTCPSDHFVCSNGKCILNRWRCDGWEDCADGSDENIAVCALIPCHANAFKCPNLKCIRNTALCNGFNDCEDNADESVEVCESLPKCRHDQFQCENDVCISKKLRCDGQYNCIDGSDEMNCRPPVCGFSTCSQICIEKKAGHYNCKCVDGYQKGKEKNDTCLATGPEQILLLASEQEFRFLFPNKHQGTTIMKFIQTGSLKIDVFDFLILENEILLFWIDSHHNKIHTIKFNATDALVNEMKYETNRNKRSVDNVDVIEVSNLDDPKSLAIDWITLKLYIIDSRHNRIIVTDIYGKNYVSLVSTGMHPTDIVLEPESRIMIWSTLENGILIASLDGTNKKSLVEIDVGWPISLSIDYPTGRLYWADYRKGTIETCLLNGKDRHVVKRFQNNEKPQKIDVFEDFLYIKLYDQSIIKMNKFGTDNGTYLLKGYRSSDIAIIHPLKQNRNISNPCDTDQCNSTNAMCILSSDSSTGFTCTCPSDLVMVKVNGKSECKTYESMPEYCSLKCGTGSCKIIDHVSKCVCPPQYDGEMCEHYRCSGYCFNDGYCEVLVKDNSSLLKCQCKDGWSGTRCNISLTECQSRCHNGGSCHIVEDVPSCKCPQGFLGDKCEHCVNLTCENGGVCRETVTNATQCDCPDGYIGKRCEISVCNGYCNNHGKCISGIRGAQCECDPGYWGKQCETNSSCIDYCHNDGTCINNHEIPTCVCPPRYSGTRCQIDLCLTFHPPENCDQSIVPIRTPCSGVECQNGGVCHIIRNMGICNCTEQWNGELCDKYVGYSNRCTGYCLNGAICQLDNFLNPSCICIGEWNGYKCDSPPLCTNGCGVCQIGSTINECLCDDGTVSPCNYESSNIFSEERQNTAETLTILAVILSILILLIFMFGAAVIFLKRRRLGQPFSHARLNDNVEITNPMYLGDMDDAPSFVHEDEKGNFANPVYESMYAGSVQDQSAIENSSTATDERKGLLQHSHDENNSQHHIL